MTSIYIGHNCSNTELLGYICFINAECVCCLRHHNPYVRLWLKSTSVKVMMSCSWHAWRLGFVAPLIYKRAAPLLSVPVITQPFSEGTVWWMRSEHGRCSRRDNSRGFWSSLQSGILANVFWLHSYSKCTQWLIKGHFSGSEKRQHSAWRLSLSIVFINCEWLNKVLVLSYNWRKLDDKKCITAELLSLYDQALCARACSGMSLHNILRTKPA